MISAALLSGLAAISMLVPLQPVRMNNIPSLPAPPSAGQAGLLSPPLGSSQSSASTHSNDPLPVSAFQAQLLKPFIERTLQAKLSGIRVFQQEKARAVSEEIAAIVKGRCLELSKKGYKYVISVQLQSNEGFVRLSYHVLCLISNCLMHSQLIRGSASTFWYVLSAGG